MIATTAGVPVREVELILKDAEADEEGGTPKPADHEPVPCEAW